LGAAAKYHRSIESAHGCFEQCASLEGATMDQRVRTLVQGLAATAVLASAPDRGAAQDRYPVKPVKIVVPFSAGTAVDALPRLLAERLMPRLGQPFVVENRPGASGNIGADLVAHADPDGYTLLASPAPPLIVNQYLYAHLAFDPAAFVPVTVIATAPNVLVVHPSVPAATVQELVEYAKANPDKLNYASPGNGTTPHLTAELMKMLAGIRIVHVPYKGGSPALADLLAGQVQMMFANLGDVLPYMRSGKLVAVGVASERRLPTLPMLPTLSEQFPGFVSVAWYAIVAPPRTPLEIATRLSTAIKEVLQLPEVAARLDEMTATAVGGTPAETADFMKGESERWRKVIAAASVRLD
jgi:tripartite-type tricarboxylate transporter receptor subunit TctC